jgi:uncharacterized protein (UPF0261 family)
MVAPGAIDLLDFAGWQDIPEQFADRPFHEHNRLIKSSVLDGSERRSAIREIATRLAAAKGPTHFFLPVKGVQAWDQEGEETYDPEALADMLDEARQVMPARVDMTEVDAHINDAGFAEAVLARFDDWVAQGVVKAG